LEGKKRTWIVGFRGRNQATGNLNLLHQKDFLMLAEERKEKKKNSGILDHKGGYGGVETHNQKSKLMAMGRRPIHCGTLGEIVPSAKTEKERPKKRKRLAKSQSTEGDDAGLEAKYEGAPEFTRIAGVEDLPEKR